MTPKALTHVWLSAGQTGMKLYPGEGGVRKVAVISQDWILNLLHGEKKDEREMT